MIGIEVIPTAATVKHRLRTPIVSRLMPTARAGLRGMTRIDTRDHDPTLLRFVGNEAVHLRKGPGMQFALPFAFAMLNAFSKIGQILKDNRCSWGRALHDAFGEHMIAVPAESQRATRHLKKMSFRTFCSFGLKPTTETKPATLNLFLVTGAKKLLGGGDCRTDESQVHPDHVLMALNHGLRDTRHHMQPPRPVAGHQVCGGRLAHMVALAEVRNGKGEAHPALRGGETNRLSLPVERVGMNVVPDRTC
nr:hypothetical protein [Ktedonospora formicarum]